MRLIPKIFLLHKVNQHFMPASSFIRLSDERWFRFATFLRITEIAFSPICDSMTFVGWIYSYCLQYDCHVETGVIVKCL